MKKRKKALADQLLSSGPPSTPFQPAPTPMQGMEQLFSFLNRPKMITLFKNYQDNGNIPQMFKLGPENPIKVPDALDDSEQAILKSLQNAMNTQEANQTIYEQALVLKKKYPEEAMIAELVLGYLITMGERELMLETATDMLKSFPHNLYARNILVLNALNDRNLTEVEQILEHKFEIYEHSAPEKEIFEAPEVLNFYGALGNYYVLKENIPRALWCYIVCREVDPQGEVVEMLSQTILTYLQDESHQNTLKRFLEAKQPRKLKKLSKR